MSPQTCKNRETLHYPEILHEIFYTKITKWVSKAKNYLTTKKKVSKFAKGHPKQKKIIARLKKVSVSFQNYTSKEICAKQLYKPFHELKI